MNVDKSNIHYAELKKLDIKSLRWWLFHQFNEYDYI